MDEINTSIKTTRSFGYTIDNLQLNFSLEITEDKADLIKFKKLLEQAVDDVDAEIQK